MATTHLVSVEEYLHSSFEPDAEYVEGRIVHRSVPQKPHSKVQTHLAAIFCQLAPPMGYEPWVEQRVRTKLDPTRYRVPDLCLTAGEPAEDIFTEPPFLCIEILSPDDSAAELRVKINEYLDFGVPYVWVIDPISFTGEIHTPEAIERVRDGRFRAGNIEVDISRIQSPES
jgi:Uma2 family endonuclease